MAPSLLPKWLIVIVLSSIFSSSFSHALDDQNWYQKSWIHSHLSLALPADNLQFMKQQMAAGQLDAIQYHVTGSPKLWEAVRKAKLDQDLGFKMVATINAAGTWSHFYEKNPDCVYRIHPDGSFAGRWDRKHLCFNAPYVDKHILPEKYQRLPKKLQPDQVWIDECVITVNLCWCQYCTKLYREKYQSEPPVQLTKNNRDDWTKWTTFHRECFENWTQKVYQAVNRGHPDTLVTFNHAWFIEQPETPPNYIKNLSADVHKDPLELGIYAKYGGSGKLPFDIMPGLSSDVWAGDQPKKLETVLNEVAIINAHGGRWNIGEYPTNFKSLRQESKKRGVKSRPADVYLELAKQGAQFSRSRQTFCQHTSPLPHISLLHSASTHYDHVINHTNQAHRGDGFGKTSDGTFKLNQKGKINSRIYWPNNHPISPNLVGAYQAMLENHLHFNFTIEDRLSEDLKNTKLLVLVEQHRLSPKTQETIRSYLQNGGKVLATGSTRLSGLSDLFNDASTSPRSIGKGQVLYLKENFFGDYIKSSGYSRRPKGASDQLRNKALELFKTILPKDDYNLIAPPWFEWTLRQSENKHNLMVHLINRKTNWSGPLTPEPKQLRVSLRLDTCPKNISLEPGNEKVQWNYDEGKLEFSLKTSQVQNHRIVHVSFGG